MNFITIKRCIILTCKKNINFNVCKKFSTISFNKVLVEPVLITKLNLQSNQKNLFYTSVLQFCTETSPNKPKELNKEVNLKKSDSNYHANQFKKRPKKRKSLSTGKGDSKSWTVTALSTSEEYNLEALMQGLKRKQLYEPTITSLPDVIHAVARYKIDCEPREIFFFQEGTVVMWNISDLERDSILKFLREYEENRYVTSIVQSEGEMMNYSYSDGKHSHIKDGNIVLNLNATYLDKYTFSNAMAQAVKLGIWEASLDVYIDSIEFVTEDLKAGRKLKLTQEEVLKKQGELFALRHLINLSSDLLDIPDFYWERDDLKLPYQQTCSYFNITKRTKVINEKLNHCVELVSILSAHLSDRHHIRLEWMIIILIMVEVVFETIHYMDRYFT